MRLAKFVTVLAAVAGPALAQPTANVIDVAPPTDSGEVVVLRGSSAPPQPGGGPPILQAPSTAATVPVPAYTEQAYVPLHVPPGNYQTAPQPAPRHVPPAPQVAPPYPIRPWGVGLAPFQR